MFGIVGLMYHRADLFTAYLRALPDEQLEAVTVDYIWLAGLDFDDVRRAEFERRRECCRMEWTRRGRLERYRRAERGMHSAA